MDRPLLPVVAIVGRPNVGKSTLFNKLVGRRKAIVQDVPGLTRDRNDAVCTYRLHQFMLVDTAGFLPAASREKNAREAMAEEVRRQTRMAIAQSDVILFMTDARSGITPLDQEVHTLLRKSGKPVYCVVNKTEGKGRQGLLEFHDLGVPVLYPISSEHNEGLSDLLDALLHHFVPRFDETAPPKAPRIVVMGRPNVGKSTLTNRLLREERMVTSDIPGTTRDAIEVPIQHGEKDYLLVDTAGIRRRGKVEYGPEQYSVARAREALKESDLALLLIDAEEGVTEQDTKIAGMILQEGRGVILLVNKSDRLEVGGRARLADQIGVWFPFLHDPPIEYVSALEGIGIETIFAQIDAVYTGLTTRVTTGDLNRFFEKTMQAHPPPLHRGRPLRLYYITQAAISPPTFILFANAPKGVPDHYLRYIENQLRSTFGFTGAPLRLRLRQRK
jgi:GTP-binding protein